MQDYIILAVDPGPVESAYVYMKSDYHILDCAKVENRLVEVAIIAKDYHALVMEEAICRKWAGREVSDTAFQAGMMCAISSAPYHLINRSKVRWAIGKDKKANDSVIITKLIERFCPDIDKAWKDGDLSRTVAIDQAKERFFHDFVGDIWQAYALGVTFIDTNKGE